MQRISLEANLRLQLFELTSRTRAIPRPCGLQRASDTSEHLVGLTQHDIVLPDQLSGKAGDNTDEPRPSAPAHRAKP
jgi:hypothetical protein